MVLEKDVSNKNKTYFYNNHIEIEMDRIDP